MGALLMASSPGLHPLEVLKHPSYVREPSAAQDTKGAFPADSSFFPCSSKTIRLQEKNRPRSHLSLHLSQLGSDQPPAQPPFLFVHIRTVLLCLKLLNIHWTEGGEEGVHGFALSLTK